MLAARPREGLKFFTHERADWEGANRRRANELIVGHRERPREEWASGHVYKQRQTVGRKQMISSRQFKLVEAASPK